MEMDQLVSSLNDSSLGCSPSQLRGSLSVYISEVSSPTRLWMQDSESKDIDQLIEEMRNFYDKQGDAFSIQPAQAIPGVRIAAKFFSTWNRAEIVSITNERGNLRVLYIDYGTVDQIPLKDCRILLETFSTMRSKAIRGSLHGIQPVGGSRLWNLNVTQNFIDMIRNKVHRIKIVKHHEYENFYEFLLYDGQSNKTVNEIFIEQGVAEPFVEVDKLPPCALYPSFNMLEKLHIYPTYGERCLMFEKHQIDFNEFEEANIQPVTNTFSFQIQLGVALNSPRFSSIRAVFLKTI